MASGALMKAALLQENMNLYACAAWFCILPLPSGEAQPCPPFWRGDANGVRVVAEGREPPFLD
jgi:hypothetical protein